ncbi:MAG: peptide ABC transporter substrate-binding protein [Bdellovibrionales bacterium]|nr:peptide ABC transporter substrate-binding protein [Bdellovibrionales bacterium]
MVKNLTRTAVLFSLVFAMACTKKKSNDYDLDMKETLRINLTTEPPSLDWAKSSDTTSALITDNIMEGLTEYDLSDPELSLKPALATKWEASNKAKTWTFTLRKGVKWSDGVEFTAQHVIDGWVRLLSKETASNYSYFLFGVKNAKKFNAGEIKDPAQLGIKVNNEGQLVVELEDSMSYFPYLLTHHSTFPVRIDTVKKFGDLWTEPQNIQTLGAYKLKRWDHDKALILERNDNYYGEKAKTKYILGYIVQDISTAVNLFNTDRLDAQRPLLATELKHLRKKKEFKEQGILGIYYFGFNTKKAPMNNPTVRKAIAHAIDRREITTMLNGGETPIKGWIPVGMFGHETDVGLDFDPKLAGELLDKAGYKDRAKFPKLMIGFNTNENHQRIAENVQAQLKRNLGINVELKNEEWKVYLKSLKVDPPHIYRMGWLADFPDPDNFLNLVTSYSENNYSGWGNPKFDKLIEKAVSITDKDERRKIYREAQRILVEQDVPVVPIYSMVDHMLISDRVKNYPVNSMSRFVYKDVEVKDK